MTATIAKMVNTDAKAYILPGVSAMTCEEPVRLLETSCKGRSPLAV